MQHAGRALCVFFINKADCIGTQWSCTDFQLAKGSEVCS